MKCIITKLIITYKEDLSKRISEFHPKFYRIRCLNVPISWKLIVKLKLEVPQNIIYKQFWIVWNDTLSPISEFYVLSHIDFNEVGMFHFLTKQLEENRSFCGISIKFVLFSVLKKNVRINSGKVRWPHKVGILVAVYFQM